MKKILFFDDEKFLSGLLLKNLKDNYKMNITYVSEAEELLKEIGGNTTYALFIIDIMAPLPTESVRIRFTHEEIEEMEDGMKTGIVLAKKIWAVEKYKNTHIIFLTGRCVKTPQGYEILSTYFRKPVKASVIADKINQILNN